MKPRIFFLAASALGVGIFVGWLGGRNSAHTHGASPMTATNGTATARRIAYYQSPMHPWIKSDQPGNCTICGMKLMPVYEGGPGFESKENVVVLSSNTVTALHLQTDVVKRQTLTRTLRLTGTLDDNEAKHQFLSAYVDGRIEALHVTFAGAEVQAGQPLAEIYSPMLLAAEREYAGLSLTNLDLVPLADAARLRLRRLGLTDPQIDRLPKKPASASATEIVSPMTGTVVGKFVVAGQYVREGEKLFELADFSTMWFNAIFYERDLPWLATNLSVTVTTPSVPGRKFPGALAFINPNLDEMTRSGRARIEVENPLSETGGGARRSLLHRTYAEAEITTHLENALVIPRSAVLRPADEAIVYVEAGGNAYERRVVMLGRAGDDGFEVLEGLAEGDHVVTAGNLLIDAQAQIVRSGQPSTNLVHVHP